MNIGIDCRLYQESGLGRYIRNLINNLKLIDRENNYYIFLLDKDFDLVDLPDNFTKVRANFRWYTLEEQLKFPELLNKYNLDLVHFPHFNVPIFYNKPFIVTIHDLIHQHFNTRSTTTKNPFLHQIKKIGYKKSFAAAVNKSKKIITPSEFVKDQLIKEWNINQNKIKVTYESVDDSLVKLIGETKKTDFEISSNKFKITKPFLFYLGNAQPHKNIENLIKAFLSSENLYQNYQLVLSGPDSFFWNKIKNKYNNQNIIYTGFVSESEMVSLYKNARVFILPSLEEGFGIPVLEAMAANCPVACSNIGVLKEVAGDAAIYFDPKNIHDIAEKIEKVLKDEKLQEKLKKLRIERYKQFSWKKMTKETLKIYNTVI